MVLEQLKIYRCSQVPGLFVIYVFCSHTTVQKEKRFHTLKQQDFCFPLFLPPFDFNDNLKMGSFKHPYKHALIHLGCNPLSSDNSNIGILDFFQLYNLPPLLSF